MRRLALLILALTACGEPTAVRVTPTDRFTMPASVALTTRQGGTALLVASGNYDLTYDGPAGGTVISVDPAPEADGGSAGRAGGALVTLGPGAHVGSFVGELVVADAATCPIPGAVSQAPEALVTTRFADQVWRLPLGLDGSLGPCTGAACVVPIDAKLHDPFNLALACRPDGQRRSAFVSYLRTAELGGGLAGFLAQVDLDDPASPSRAIAVAGFNLGGMAYDAAHDRLFALGQAVLSAPVYMLDLAPCPDGLASCPSPVVTSVDLYPALAGLEPTAIALSNPQAGLGRRAYVAAHVYDPVLAALLQGRPAGDLGAVLLVLDLEEDLTGRPSLEVLRRVDIGLVPGQVRVLPVRPLAGGIPQRDLVVVTSTFEGVLTVYDDQAGEPVRDLPIDGATGAPEVGRAPFGLAAERIADDPTLGAMARVYVAASQQAVVGIVDVPLDRPGQAHAPRDGNGALIRIGGLQ